MTQPLTRYVVIFRNAGARDWSPASGQLHTRLTDASDEASRYVGHRLSLRGLPTPTAAAICRSMRESMHTVPDAVVTVRERPEQPAIMQVTCARARIDTPA